MFTNRQSEAVVIQMTIIKLLSNFNIPNPPDCDTAVHGDLVDNITFTQASIMKT